jgi:Rps23 Pro-64 3,4-dihydroxylase Tpa1-like proline 4-hydroxylase
VSAKIATMKYIDAEKLDVLSEKHRHNYQNNIPYPHIYFDNFFSNLDDVLDAFLNLSQLQFYEYNNPLEKKLGYDKVAMLPKAIVDLLTEVNSPEFLSFLEKLTGTDGLIPDPYYRGGGAHQTKRGGKLDIHIDFNIHPKLKLDRRLSLILYLNKDWKESWNGDFQVWEGYKDGEKHVLTKLHEKIYPLFNRLLIFSTSEKSYHGHPEPLNCPEDITRKSLATYYYTNGRPTDEISMQHSTTYVKLPGEDDSLDELRNRRNAGRFNDDVSTISHHNI